MDVAFGESDSEESLPQVALEQPSETAAAAAIQVEERSIKCTPSSRSAETRQKERAIVRPSAGGKYQSGHRANLEALKKLDADLESRHRRKQPRSDGASRNVVLLGLPQGLQVPELKTELGARVGPIQSIKIKRDFKIEEKAKAFVLFAELEDADYAVAQGTIFVAGANLRVERVRMPSRNLRGKRALPSPYNDLENPSTQTERRPKQQQQEQQQRSHIERLLEREVEEFQSLLDHVTLEKRSIEQVMCFCLDHADAAEHCASLLIQSLLESWPVLPKAVARLYVISDVLHNSKAAIRKASLFSVTLERELPSIFEKLGMLRQGVGKLSLRQFDARVDRVLASWRSTILFSSLFLFGLEATFYGKLGQTETSSHVGLPNDSSEVTLESTKRRCLTLGVSSKGTLEQIQARIRAVQMLWKPQTPESIDGEPLDDVGDEVDSIDGVPI